MVLAKTEVKGSVEGISSYVLKQRDVLLPRKKLRQLLFSVASSTESKMNDIEHHFNPRVMNIM
jgi:hypothetical protein